MNPSVFSQWSVIALVLLVSVVFLVHRQWPKVFGRFRRSLVIWMLRPMRWAWVRRAGRMVAPVPTVKGFAGGSCGGCGGCGTKSVE